MLNKLGGLRGPFTSWNLHGGFSPLSLFALAEPGAWYDPSDISTLFQDSAGMTPVTASGDPVGLMLDKSGRGNHATQATAARRPTYTTGSGLAWLAFDGVDDSMATGTITPGTDKVQVFAGVRKLSDTTIGIVAELSANASLNNGSFSVLAPHSNGVPGYEGRSKGSATERRATVATGYAAPTSNVLGVIAEISTDTLLLNVDGSQVASTVADQGTGDYLAYPLYIGRRGGASLPFTGNLYGMIVRFGAPLDVATIASTDQYMASKTGVTI